MTSESTILETDEASGPKRSRRRTWHFTPALPVKQAPYFEKPFDPGKSLRYLLNIWRPFNQRFLLLMLSIAAWTWFTPSLEHASDFRLDWILEIGLRNLVIVFVVAGGLHLLPHSCDFQCFITHRCRADFTLWLSQGAHHPFFQPATG